MLILGTTELPAKAGIHIGPRGLRRGDSNHAFPRNLGNALITALFIMTLIAIAATALIHRLSTDILRTTQLIQSDKTYLAAQLVPFWGMSQLSANDLPPAQEDTSLFSLPRDIATLYPQFTIEGKVYDLQSRFNLNNLTDAYMQQTFLNLLQTIDPTLSAAFRKLITNASKDWITQNPANTQNSFAQYYQKMSPAYQSAYQPMVSVSEWNQVAGVQPELYKKLSNFLTALPEVTPINLNTAPKILLQALNPKMEPSQLEALMNIREQGGIQSQTALNQWAKSLGIDPSAVTYQSQYFLSVATLRKDKKIFKLYDIIKRSRKKITEPWQATIIAEHR